MPFRHHLTWADLDGARVGLWGMGIEGRASLGRLAAADNPVAVAVDSGGATVDGLMVLPEDTAGMAALATCDIVIKSPGISPYSPHARGLADAGPRVVSGMSLWIEEVDASRVIGITGTKGKSTTASIIAHLLGGLGHRVALCGNIGSPPFAVDSPTDVDRWVVEVSSYQAVDLASGPGVAVVTSLHPDHLTWHGNVEQYYADKLSICTLPGVHTVVANAADEVVGDHAGLMGSHVRWVVDLADASWADGLGLVGSHNIQNARLAAEAIRQSGIATPPGSLAAAATGFQPLPSRLTHVTTVDGVRFIDDSLSTNVLPTRAALRSFPGRPVALLVGGQDRGIDYVPLVDAVLSRLDPTFVLTLPTNGSRIAALFAERTLPETVEVLACEDLARAVQAAWMWGRDRDAVVLLSPAAPSFDRFTDYADRARQFRDHIGRLAVDS